MSKCHSFETSHHIYPSLRYALSYIRKRLHYPPMGNLLSTSHIAPNVIELPFTIFAFVQFRITGRITNAGKE